MTFRITGLSPAPFQFLFGLAEADLVVRGARRCHASAKPGFPDRVGLRDAEPGQALLLVNYLHQPAETPYRASHAIFVLEGATTAYDEIGEIPPALQSRTISLRAFDETHMMIDAALTEGEDLPDGLEQLLANPAASYIHAHFATRGCYAARAERA